MKRFNFIPAVIAIVLMITAASCTTMTGTQDEYYERSQANRIYVEDPYRGTVVLERDPYTGRYYDVTYGSRIGSLYNGYYPYRTYRHNGGYYRSYGTIGGQLQRQTPSNDTYQKDRGDARQKVLGNPKR